MKHTQRWMFMGAAALVFAACDKHDGGNNGNNGNSKHVYTINNSVKGNFLMEYRRASNGQLTLDTVYDAGGVGTGSGLGSQGAVIIADDGTVLAVNAGSNTISSFRRSSHGLSLVSTVGSGGTMPISITSWNSTVFVLNAAGGGNFSGFNLSATGKLSAMAGSTHALSSNASGPAEIAFVNNGSALVVTEKATNKITSYTSSGAHSLVSANATPFGFAVGRNGNIYVSEAAGGGANASTVSSYHIDYNGAIKLVTGPVAASQTAACWVVLTDNNKYAYVSNTGSNNMSSLNVNGNSGVISVNKANAAGTGSKPTDAVLSSGSEFLYVITPASNTINCYRVGEDGGLTSIQTINGIAGSAVGLAAN